MFLINIIDPIALGLYRNGIDISSINFASIIVRILLAVVLSFVIGIERSSRNHSAGVRTYILVTLGATIAMLTNQFIFETYGVGDVSRLGAQVISGIGFLGAGTIIITSKSQIRGLTTAAGLWSSACVGLAVGVGFYTLALIGGIVIVLVFTIMQGLENYFKDRARSFTIHIELDSTEHLRDLTNFIRSYKISISRLELNQAYQKSGLAVYTIFLYKNSFHDKETLHIPFIKALEDLEYVNYVEEIN